MPLTLYIHGQLLSMETLIAGPTFYRLEIKTVSLENFRVSRFDPNCVFDGVPFLKKVCLQLCAWSSSNSQDANCNRSSSASIFISVFLRVEEKGGIFLGMVRTLRRTFHRISYGTRRQIYERALFTPTFKVEGN
ncbi:LOW QUALITY PROTEIN: hypothetical protein NC652_001105 [Populus alba x Populus x berolinensis]|nr:LOW QUALITY PROTEIN: hypothetical protein NC652_001105 [Populus alba x Populus x berolinensis]